MGEPAGDDLLMTHEVAALFGVTGETIRRMLNKGMFDPQLVVVTPAGHRRIPRGEAERVKAELAAERRTPRVSAGGKHHRT